MKASSVPKRLVLIRCHTRTEYAEQVRSLHAQGDSDEAGDRMSERVLLAQRTAGHGDIVAAFQIREVLDPAGVLDPDAAYQAGLRGAAHPPAK